MTALYNEIDPFAADWLENLILCGAIAPGIVDRRSVVDLEPEYLLGFTQVHLFAGIGVWSYALRQAGWGDDRPCWTASFPCQPFSAAGQGAGFDDERHLWPFGHWLISICRPGVIFGEQVSSKDGLSWLDLVHADMEATGYAFGAMDLCAAGVGAPHIRQRSFWMANANTVGRHGWGSGETGRQSKPLERFERFCSSRVVGDSHDARLAVGSAHPDERGIVRDERNAATRHDVSSGLADANGGESGNRSVQSGRQHRQFPENGRPVSLDSTRPTNGRWADVDWLFCRDGKWRPVEPGTFPLANGAPNRVGALRGYGNAINAPLAQIFIETAMEYLAIDRPVNTR